ncbi:MAG: hypothetical protein FJZ64_03790, partial [Chlamydiae bacterium]|nr:hypothetical protein [Chlamydiota bacterium]
MHPILVYLITCHAGPSTHFAAFANDLREKGYQVEILASGPGFKSLSPLGATDFNPSHFDLGDLGIQEKIAITVAGSLKPDGVLITDVGHPLMGKIQETVARNLPNVKRLAYYDNPEPFVPGYSETAEKVMKVAEKVLFLNAKLVKDPTLSLPQEKRIAIGYYPLEFSQKLKTARIEKQTEIRKEFFEKLGMKDEGQKILVYFGGNNDIYFSRAFPAFLKIVQEAKFKSEKYLILFQQHPGAKEKNIDGNLMQNTSLVLSPFTTEKAQILADVALYYQTSMGPQFAIAQIPAIQIGH